MAPDLPNHVAIIPDGNRRYALKQGAPLIEAYRTAADKVTKCIEWFLKDFDVPTLSIYGLSYDNVVGRPEPQLIPIYNVQVMTYERWVGNDLFHKNKINVKFIGERELLPDYYQDSMKKLENATKDYKKHQLYILSAYSGRLEIMRAAKKFIAENGDREVREYSAFYKHLDIPTPVDYTIRTANEKRLSDCLVFQNAYAEFYFIEKYFPEIEKEDVWRALQKYMRRERRHGQ